MPFFWIISSTRSLLKKNLYFQSIKEEIISHVDQMRHLNEAYNYLLKKSADQSHIAHVKTKYEKFKRMRDEVLSRQSQLENKFKIMGAPQVWMTIFKIWYYYSLKESDKRRLLVFERSVLRRILGVLRRDRRRNEDIRSFLGLSRNVVDEVQHRRLMYFGHVCRMEAARFPYITLFGRIHGSRPVGRPKKRWLDDVRTDCTELGLSMYQAVRSAQDHALWRRMLEELPRRTPVSQRP